MINFILGFIVGLLFAILDFVLLAYFRRNIEQKLTIVEKQIANAGPRPQGFIIEPEDEVNDWREEQIEKNRQQGKDTRLEDLI